MIKLSRTHLKTYTNGPRSWKTGLNDENFNFNCLVMHIFSIPHWWSNCER